MDLLDILLMLVVLAYAASGYRRGLVAGCVSLAGFVGGAVVGVWILPWVMDLVTPGTTRATVTAVFTVLLPAVVGHELAGRLGLRLRRELDRGPLRVADGVGGAAANAVAVLIVAWVAASVLGASSSPLVTSAIRDSRLLGAVQDAMPDTTPAWFSRATSALTEAGFPQVFNPFENESTAEVAAPTGDSVTPAATRAAQRSTVKVEGVAGTQGREGSGFVYAREHVMTNAHVVAGIDEPTVRVGGVGRTYEARVVLFDAQTDVAVLYVPDLVAPVLAFDDDAERGAAAVVAGYPQDGDLNLQAATVAGRVQARGQNIYNDAPVTREIYSIRSTVRPGNSGGPLLTTDGRVFGVVFARSTSDAETGYVLTADEVADEAARAATATAPVDTGQPVLS
ncbi:MarP family serine protease [Streptomyces cellulosae]|uniref:S1-C subfamily serine protease n=1 Tax=Streptomyces thermodiastaticus TaxID=44061 RepID=A0ABU0KQJ0_9ACTN|nr:MarP family serine protease [Streptomyces sp. McG7]MDQ0491706.1 S1-C subfamily serine protease [Streptomyces thermodiastaticus]MDX3416021.1 MarP family serine protease [Streptomyces sp. MD20-1-1]MYW50176.1 MarP family serine protease [Streptomyces sp. SID8376]THC57903.1 MarP family serine protease [Streptomyces sp. Akac8]UVT09413.1 MarP family serine protease [Streptomyces thermocarboxydus]WSB41075.1 MarP family serine protease [Streptomyces cellulosae]